MKPKIVRLNKWSDIHRFASKDFAGWLFRGQCQVNWELESLLERCCKHHGVASPKWRDVEDRLLREFRRTYHQYAQSIPGSEALIEWIALMQHHGAPTRLLDFSYSVYIAAYFATEHSKGACAIWAVDAVWMRKQAAKLMREAGKNQIAVEKMKTRFEEGDEPIISELFFSKPYVPAACPINPFRLNERLRIQQGSFLISGDVSRSFEDNLKSLPDGSGRFLKIVIPKKLVREARHRLFQMAISRASLFPGLDGYCHSLHVYSPAIVPPFDWYQN